MSEWEMVRLGDVLKYEQPSKYIVESTNYDDMYKTPVLTAGQSFILGYTGETSNVFVEVPVIIFDDFTTAIKYVDFPFKVKSSAMKILKPTEKAHIRYIFYYMNTVKIDTQLHKRYWISKYADIQAPLPPLEIQKQIADTLDKASMLISQRKQQLEQLDLLVKSRFVEMFGDPVESKMGWETRPLENICTSIVDCPHSTPSYTNEDTGFMCIRTSIVKKNKIMWEDIEYISEEEFSQRVKRKKPERGDIVYTREGAILGVAAIIDRDFNVALGQRSMLLSPNATICRSEFLSIAMNFDSFLNKVLEQVSGSASPHINVGDIRAYRVMLPPLPIQNAFADFVHQVDKSKFEIQQGLKQLELQYSALMQQYFG